MKQTLKKKSCPKTLHIFQRLENTLSPKASEEKKFLLHTRVNKKKKEDKLL